MITALMLKPGEQPCTTQIVDSRNFLNCAVSLDADFVCTAAAVPVERGVVAIYAWEGLMAGLKANRKVGKRILCGTFYVVREIDGDLYSLSPEDIVKYTFKLGKIKEYTDDEVVDSWLDGL